jgi:hypothetical protein
MNMNPSSIALRFIGRCLAMATLIVSLPVFAIAQSAAAKPISEKGLTDALKLGGLSESELIDNIKTRGVDFQLTAQSEKSLRAVGATDKEIAAVRANYRSVVAVPVQIAPEPANLPVQAPAPAPVIYAPGIYLQNGSAWTPLPVESVAWEGAGLMRGLSKVSGGLLNEQITGTVAGSHSGTTVRSPVQFMLQLAPGNSADNYLLLHLHGKHDNRDFKAGLGGGKSSDEVAFQSTKTGDNSYQVKFTAGSGDYAFVLRGDIPKEKGSTTPGKAYTFRIPD